MNPDYSRLPLSPAERVEGESQDFFLDKDLEFYDDLSIRKRVKPNENGEIPAHFPYNRPPNDKPAVPTKPHYSFPQERNNFNRQPNPPGHRQFTHETHHRKLTPPTMSEDFIPLDVDSPRESQDSRRSDRPPQRGYNDDRDSYNNRSAQRSGGYNDRGSQREWNNRDSGQKGWNDSPSGRSWNDRSRQNDWGDDNSSDRGGWGNRSQQGNWDDNNSDRGDREDRRDRGWDNNRSQQRNWNDNRDNNSSDRGWNNNRSQQRNWNDNRDNRDNRDSRGSDRDYDKPARRDWNNNNSNNRSSNRNFEDSGSEYSDSSSRDRGDRGYQYNNNSRNSYSRDRSDYGNRSYSRQDTKRESSESNSMFLEPLRVNPAPGSLLAKTLQLPIYPFKSEIVESIRTNQVTIISGDTGCGKSTQVPKYILEDCMRRGVECRIICTQPRRIAAITLAKRVQKEMAELYPDADPKMVGFHIGMETNFNKYSKIIFVTNGIFLQRFIHEDENTEGGILKGFTHAILDEVHERDIDSDFIMVALKHVLSRHPNFKLTLMSATINADLFARYFSKNEIERVSNYFFDYQKNQRKALTAWDETPMKWEKAQENEHEELSKQTIDNYKISADSTWGAPVDTAEEERKRKEAEERNAQLIREKEEFKHDMNYHTTVIEINQKHIQSKDKYVIHKKYLDQLKPYADIRCSLMLSDFSKKKAIFHEECIRICLQLIAHLTSSKNKIESQIRANIAEEIAIEKQLYAQGKVWNEGRKRTYLPYMLIFLPGLSEIYHLMDVITEEKTLSHLDFDLIPLHSTLSDFNQERLFKDPNHPEQRKIILSTNIAESSITIPNVLYIIDFCLLKEINTSGRTGIEILDLVWGSKASLQQRAGRTGRVSDGYVFRLIPETFYDKDLDAFSKPELHRSPLDRLILRIKTLYESEKQAKKTENCLFTDPKQVLGRAIEPPQLESIAIAVRNLQDNGALTVSQNTTHLGEITFLGKVYCDLPCEVKISKMILLGLAFGLKEEVIALAAVLCQRKSLFRPDTKAVPRNRYAYMRNLYNMADGTNSDHVALLRTFASWERRFIPTEASVHYVRKMREREEEKDYCRDRLLDPIVLRETYITKQDIIGRLRKLEILKKPEELMEEENQKNAQRRYFWEDPDLDRSKINEKYAIMKFVLAGAFYCTYIRPSEFKRQFDTNQSNYIKSNTGMDPLKTIVIRHTYKGIENWDADKVAVTKQNWNKMLKKFTPEEIRFIQDKAYISFNDNDYEFSIKTLDYIKKSFYDISRQISVYNKEYGSTVREELTFRHTSNPSKQQSNIFYSHWMDPDCVSLFAGLGEVEYYSAYEFVDYLTRKKIKIEPDSINNIVPVKNPGAPICLVTQDYFEKKSGVLSAKHTTMIDFEFFECKFLLPLLTMIFAPQIQLDPDEAKTRYKSMTIDGNELDLEFYLTSKDIEEINEIRHLLQDFFMNKDRHIFQNTYFSLWNSIQDLFKKERVLYIPQEKWEDRFKQEYENKLSKISVENVQKRLKKPAPKKVEDKDIKTSYHYYLIPIQAKELPNARFANYSAVQDAAKESQKYYSLYTEWKKAKVIQIKRNLRLIDQKVTFLACGICGTKLCDFTCIGDQIINGFYRHLKCSEFIFKVIACSSEDAFYTNWHLEKIKNHKFLHNGEYVQHNVLGCYQNHELALKVWHRDFSKLTPEQTLNLYKRTQGVKTEGEGEQIDPLSAFPIVENLYITRFSNLKLVYPDDTQEPFSFDAFSSVEMIKKNREKLTEREKRLQYLSCPICNVERFEQPEDYKAHLKSRGHQEEYKKFVETLPEIPE